MNSLRINWLTAVAFIIFPVYVVSLALIFKVTDWRLGFGFLIILHALYRTWETFYTTKDWRRLEFHGDWTLLVSTILYMSYCFLCAAEFFCIAKQLNLWPMLLGVLFYTAAFLLRRWGELALGSQWSIHAVGVQKIKKVRLLRIGPFRYIRHPIYAGIMLDAIAISLILNTWNSLLLALFLFVPFMFIRAVFEERTAVRRFGQEEYEAYVRNTDMFLPIKVFFYRKV
jgi:protein-S-isoprenylcysteine O-methyltransferase Ste14